MNDCSQHKKEVAGISDTKVLARMIVDTHYQWQSELWKEISNCYKQDSRKDWVDRKIKLSQRLKAASINSKQTYIQITEAWQISKPFMEQPPKQSKL